MSLRDVNSNKTERKEEFKLIKTLGESIPHTLCRIMLTTQATWKHEMTLESVVNEKTVSSKWRPVITTK